MTQPLDDLLKCVDAIVADTLAALTALKRWSDNPKAKNVPKVSGRAFEHGEVELFRGHLDRYATLLRYIARDSSPNLKTRCKRAEALLPGSLDGRVCAVLRALHDKHRYADPETVLGMAGKLDVLKPIPEPVQVSWIGKGKGGYRTIVVFGPRRTAQCLLVRDMLSVLGIDSDLDFSRKGGGGERALVRAVSDRITKNYGWWWTPDIKSCFASIRPGHLGWLPIDRRLLMNVVFLPRCAKIEVAKPKDAGVILAHLHASLPDLPVGEPSQDITTPTIEMVRRGLPQGSVLSPLLARAVVGRNLRGGLSETKTVGFSYCDDLTIGARTKQDAKAAKHVLTSRFSSLLAGPFHLHDAPIRQADRGHLVVLGYDLQPGRGYGGNPVHVKPGTPRIERFRARLAERLAQAGPDDDLEVVAHRYWKSWYASQRGWTRVPLNSADISWTITLCYVDDFLNGQPMGIHAYKPLLSKPIGYEQPILD